MENFNGIYPKPRVDPGRTRLLKGPAAVKNFNGTYPKPRATGSNPIEWQKCMEIPKENTDFLLVDG